MSRESHSKRRKSKTSKEENLYKILGTRSNIGQGRIKEKYLGKLREFPPETHPEEFEEIRRAYETLKDVNKRKQYDILRKYGNKLEKIIDDIMYSISIEEFEKAQKLINYLLEIDPDNTTVRLTQAELFLELEELEEFFDLMDKIIETCDVEERQHIVLIKFTMLYSKGYSDKAFDALSKDSLYITDMEEFHELRAMVFLQSGNFQQAWEELKHILPSINNLTIDDLDLLLNWLNIGIELEKWGEISKIQNYFKKLSKKIIDEEELSILKHRLIEEAEEYIEVDRFREANVYMQLASQIYNKDILIKERSKEIELIAKLEMELIRLSKDHELFPYVHMKIMDLFLAKYSNSRNYGEFLNDYPHEMMNELEWMKEDIAAGILRIKKKYPPLYREFNKELTELFNESVKGLNREQRRELR